MTKSLFILVFSIALLTSGCFRKPPEQRPSNHALLEQIHEAVENCETEKVSQLLKEDFNFNEAIPNKEPLFISSLYCRPNIQQTLMSAGVDVNAQDKHGRTAAMYVVEGYFRVTHLISRFARSKFKRKQIGFRTPWPQTTAFEDSIAGAMRNMRGSNKMREAVRQGKLRRKLRAYEKAVNAILKKSDLSIRDNEGLDVMAHAIKSSGPEVLERLVKLNAKLDIRYSGGRQAIHFAAEGGRERIVEYLLKHGADLKAVDDEGHNALYFALKSKRSGVLEPLVNGGLDINAPLDNTGTSAIKILVDSGNYAMLSALGNYGADFSLKNEKGESLLFDLIRGAGTKLSFYHRHFKGNHYQTEMLAYSRILRNRGEKKKPSVATSLMGMMSKDRKLIMRGQMLVGDFTYALKRFLPHCDLNAPNSDGVTPLILLAQTARIPEAAKYLLQAGAKLDWKDANGETALFHAVRARNLSLTEFFIEQGADLKAKNKKGQTVFSLTPFTMKETGDKSQPILSVRGTLGSWLARDTMRLLLAKKLKEQVASE